MNSYLAALTHSEITLPSVGDDRISLNAIELTVDELILLIDDALACTEDRR
jgi:hypothetical protein